VGNALTSAGKWPPSPAKRAERTRRTEENIDRCPRKARKDYVMTDKQFLEAWYRYAAEADSFIGGALRT
jgi:hypothetical protein